MSKKIFSLLIVLIPLLKPYLLFGINADILALLVVFLIFIAFFKWIPKAHKLLKPYLLLSIYSILIPPYFATQIWGTDFSVVFLPILIYIFLSLSIDKMEFNRMFRFYKWITIICCVFFFVQEISYYTTSVRIPGLIPYLDNVYTKSWNMSTQDLIERQAMITRSASFFLEPAHFVQYIAPCLMIMLLNKRFFSIYTIVLISSAMLLSRSGNGLILLAIGYTSYFFSTKSKFIYKIVVIGCFIGGVLYFSKTQEGEELFERSSELSLTNPERHSGFVRVFRGYILWNDLPPILKISGIGNNTDQLFEKSNQRWMFFGDSDRFLNGIQMILIGNGIIGLVIMFYFLFRLYEKSIGDNCKKTILLSFFVLMLIESIYNTTYMIFYLCHIISDNNNNSYK